MTGGLQRLAGARYVAVGHVTVDVLVDGERRAGGTALYSALQAARLGLAATIVTRGQPDELETLLAPFSGELELIVQPARATTTLETSGSGEQRRQRMLAWAGPIELGALPAGEILHLAPVAAELAGAAEGRWAFVGLTPQGLARHWREQGDEIVACAVDPKFATIAGRCDAIVLSARERASCVELIARGAAGGATIAITAGPGATELLSSGGDVVALPVKPIVAAVDDLGAGDVFAAAFFTALAAGEDRLAAARAGQAAAALRMQGVGAEAIATAASIEAYAAALAQAR